MAYEWGRFTYWLAQGQNAAAVQSIAAVLVLLVTAWYTFLTHWIMKATARQASAALQPELSLHRFVRAEGENFHTILIENSSGRPVVFLDVVISCHRHGHKAIIHKLRGYDDQILAVSENTKLKLDFSRELTAMHVHEDSCGYQAVLVVSDLSRQVAIEYDYTWVVGRFAGKAGMPWRVRWRYRMRPWGWRYNRVKYWFRDRFKKDE
jgi:hypothetical protein